MNTALSLDYADTKTWRTPTREECITLFKTGEHRHCVYFNDLKFFCWLSQECLKSKKNAYFAHFASGKTSTYLKTRKMAVRLVRHASDDEMLVAFANTDGRFALSECQEAVIDRLTGMMWARRVVKPQMSWDDAMIVVNSIKSK